MSYIIKAYKKGSKMNIPIEDKHKYDTQAEAHDYYTFEPTNPGHKLSLIPYTAAFTGLGPAGYGAVWNQSKHNFEIIWAGGYFGTTVGTGADQRIGNKVYLKNMTILINLYMRESAKRFFNCEYVNYTDINTDATSLAGWSAHMKEEGETAAKFKFKMMMVKFDEAVDQTYIANWFNTIYVPQYYAGAGTTMPAVTNQSKMLRESTDYNGKYRILFEQSFSMNSKKGHKFINFNWEFKKNLTHDSNTGSVTDEDFTNLRLIIFSPTLLVNDMNGIAYSKLSDYMENTYNLGNAAALRNYILDAFYIQTNIKYKFYDI